MNPHAETYPVHPHAPAGGKGEFRRPGDREIRRGAAFGTKRVLTGLLAAWATSTAAALPPPPVDLEGGPVAHADVTPAEVTVGDRVTVELAVYHPVGSTLEPPPVDADDAPFDYELIDRSRETTPAGDFLRTRHTWVIAPFETGTFPLSTNRLTLITGDNATEIDFPATEIVVKSVLTGEDESLRGAKTWWSLPSRLPAMLLKLAAVILGVMLVAGLIGLVAARLLRHRQQPPPPPPPPDPWELALKQLAALRERALPPARAEIFFVCLSDIVRQYLERRFGLHAPEMTTEEFIRATAGNPDLNEVHRASTTRFLEQSDLVKFARYQPDEALMADSLEAAERLVRETRPGGVTG